MTPRGTMTRQSNDRLRRAGRQVLAARRHLGMTKVELARAAGVSDRSLARLEAGEDIRLSTYLAVLDGLAVERIKPR